MLETVTIKQLAPLAAIPVDSEIAIQGNDGPTGRFPVDQLAFPAFAAPDGASKVAYLAAVDGCLPRTVQSRMDDDVSLCNFLTEEQILDARAGIINDLTSEILAAIAHCNANNAALYVPDGKYGHTAIVVQPLLRSGLKIYGNWTSDYDPLESGSFFVQIGDGYGLTFDGESGPFYLRVEGVCFVGSALSNGGLQIVGRSSLEISRNGFIGYSNPAYPCAGLLITRNAEPFVGVIDICQNWFAYSNKGIIINQSITNVVNVIGNKFLDVKRCFVGEGNADGRAWNLLYNYFEGQADMEHAIYIDGHVLNLSIKYSYIEQNSLIINSAMIYLGQSAPGALYRSTVIAENFLQKELGSPGTSIIYATRSAGLKIENNTLAFGNQTDRFFVIISDSVEDSYIERANGQNGVEPYPILNQRTGRIYNRSHYSEEDRPANNLEIRGTGDAAGANTNTRGIALWSDRRGQITIDFDITLTTKSLTASGFAEIIGLPIANGPTPAIIGDIIATGLTTVFPIKGIIPANSQHIELIGNDGARFDFNTCFSDGDRIRGKAVYYSA